MISDHFEPIIHGKAKKESIPIFKSGLLLVASLMLFSLNSCLKNDLQLSSKGTTRTDHSPNKKQEKRAADPHIFFCVWTQMPEFPKGQVALKRYLQGHIQYPSVARKEGIHGTVVVQFLINADGSIEDVRAVGAKKGCGLEQEAVRVVKSMPKWIPAKQKEKTIRVRYSLPVRFILP